MPRASRARRHKPVVFLGPSLRVEDARAILDADFRPPIASGDLGRLPREVSIVGIIDGVFHQALAVSLREIGEAIGRGVRVFGSSSMGALRANEVAGMEGVGRVYEMYRTGEIEDDDEVALTFDQGSFRSVSEPLVNVRFAVAQLTQSGTIDQAIGRRILAAAKRLYYPDRSYPMILREAGLADRQDAAQLATMLRSHDLKREDAITLLERLGRLPRSAPRSPGPSAPREVRSTRTYAQDAPRLDELAPDAPLFFWEYGDTIPFHDVVRFMKLTGVFAGHARSAVARYLLEGNALSLRRPTPRKTIEQLAERQLAAQIAKWAFLTDEERFTTLRQLGIPAEELAEHVAEDAVGLGAVAALAREASPAFLRALRAELFLDELSLKRHALRQASLTYFAERHAAPVAEEVLAAVRYDLCERLDAVSWSRARETLALWGVGADEATRFVELVARARAAVAQMGVTARPTPRSAGRSGAPRRGLLRLTPTPKLKGDRRFCVPMRRALVHARRLAPLVKVTRVAMITGLDNIGLPVSNVARPDGSWSTTVGGGKGFTVAGAKVGGIMEEVEKWTQEQFPRGGLDGLAVRGSRARLGKLHPTIDPGALGLPFDTVYTDDLEIDWLWVTDLMHDRLVLAPAAAFILGRLRNDPLYSEYGGRKLFTTSGLASGFTLAEAVCHALAEVIERHAVTMSRIAIGNPGVPFSHGHRLVDLATAPPSTRRLVAKVTRAGHHLRVLDVTSELAVPTFTATILGPFSPQDDSFGADRFEDTGFAAHPDPEVALNGAILEAAQSRLGNISGIHEDFTLKVRSLGRHGRTIARTSAAHRLARGREVDPKPFQACVGFVSRDVKREVEWMVDRLRGAGVPNVLALDLSLPEIRPARVVRVVVPGLESLNPFRTGPRARAMLIRDLL